MVQSRFMCPVTLDQNSGGTGVLTPRPTARPPQRPHQAFFGTQDTDPREAEKFTLLWYEYVLRDKPPRRGSFCTSAPSGHDVFKLSRRSHSRTSRVQAMVTFHNFPATTVLFSSCRLRCAVMSIALCKWAGRQYPSRTPGRTLQLCHYVVCLMILSKRYEVQPPAYRMVGLEEQTQHREGKHIAEQRGMSTRDQAEHSW